MAIFLSVVLSIWALVHVYVAHRLWRLPLFGAPHAHLVLVLALSVLWVSYPLGRFLDRMGLPSASYVLELTGATWMGVLFLLLASLLVVDILTGFGAWGGTSLPTLRAGAAGAAVLLSLVGIVQGLRAPVVREADVRLPGLPADADGLRVVQLSDMHLGPLLAERWLAPLVDQVVSLQPDLVLVTGDLVDSDSTHVEEMIPTLRRLRARLGVFAVTGNHEFYAGLDRSVKLLQEAGFEVLRDRHVEVRPGLVLAGIDDLTARRQFGLQGDALATALAGRPAGATILLSHTPWLAERAAEMGVGLMLSGHTHDGQIWPFGYLVRLQYRLVGGLYRVGPLQVLVSRGTGTWGPRMRLWRPSEIWVLTLRPIAH
jgi:hypothetical protein